MSLSKYASRSCSSASAIGVNEDLITIIFLQLPVKSILKCKCVCKQWHSIASNPQFCHQHASLIRSPNPSALLFQRCFDNTSDFELCSLTGNNATSTTQIVSFDYLKSPENGNLSLLSSCNGLLLFQSLNLPEFRKYYVCNPTTKKFVELAIPKGLTRIRNLDANLAFDPCVSPHYKVVLMWRDSKNSKNRHCTAVYSSETKNWGKLGDSLAWNHVDVPVLEGSGIFCNGKIYWHVDYGETSVCFDVEENCLHVFLLPPWQRLCLPIRCFGASRGRFHAICCGVNDTYVYELNEDYSRWVVKYQLGFGLDNLMLCYFREEQDEGSTLLKLDGSGKIVAYNLKDKTTKKVIDLNPSSNESHCHYYRFNKLYEDYQWCSGAFQWIETLSCV